MKSLYRSWKKLKSWREVYAKLSLKCKLGLWKKEKISKVKFTQNWISSQTWHNHNLSPNKRNSLPHLFGQFVHTSLPLEYLKVFSLRKSQEWTPLAILSVRSQLAKTSYQFFINFLCQLEGQRSTARMISWWLVNWWSDVICQYADW